MTVWQWIMFLIEESRCILYEIVEGRMSKLSKGLGSYRYQQADRFAQKPTIETWNHQRLLSSLELKNKEVTSA